MSEPDRPWLPTNRTQSALVYALNAMLLLNLTVIAVLLSDSTPAQGDQAGPPATDETLLTPPSRALFSHEAARQDAAPAAPSRSQVADREPAVPPRILPFEPAMKPEAQAEAIAQKQPSEPTPADDPPVSFFGLGLD